jgi:thiamine biosynthesis protein ThiI
MQKTTIIHYDEIAIKGGNRLFFEKTLMNNINSKLKGISKAKVERKYGRMVILDSSEKINNILKVIPGISGFGSGLSCPLSIKEINNTAFKIVNDIDTYRIETARQNKKFDLKSPEISKEVAEFLFKKGKKTDHKDYTRKLFIEICDKEAYLFEESFKGIGGLPVGTTGKVLSLLSGGIDSPVASFFAIKRGCSVDFVHFFNDTINSRAALSKIKNLAEILTKYENQSKLYIVPFRDLQKEIILKVPSKYRMIVYKRFMLKLASIISYREKYKALVTGDNLGQVASQTLDNINTTYAATKKPILHPLIGFDKQETIVLAKKIGTYETSIQPYEDCCSLLLSKHPETKSNLPEIEEFEKEINQDLVMKAIKGMEKIKF